MELKQIIYASQPFGFDEAILSSILLDARRCNKNDAITGALVCRGDLYLQLLEGPADKVDAALVRIARDDRHLNINLLVDRAIKERMFDGWDMLHDPAKSWLWSTTEINEGVLKREAPDGVISVFATLASKVADDAED